MKYFGELNRVGYKKKYFLIVLLFSYCISFGQYFDPLTSETLTNSIANNTTVEIETLASQNTNFGTYTADSTSETTNYNNNLETNYKLNYIFSNPIPSCLENISQNIDLGLCSANIITPNPIMGDNYFISNLTWELTGATLGTSPTTEINYLGTHLFNKGITTVTYRAADAAGNSATCTYTVTVIDNQAPVFTSCPTGTTSICADNATSYSKNGISWNALATDECSAISSVRYSLSGSTTGTGTSLHGVAFNVGTTTVTWTATDTAGNTSNCIFSVTVIGLPIITSQPIDQLDCEGASVNFTVVCSGAGLTYSWHYKKPLDVSFNTLISNSTNVDNFNENKIKISNVGSTQFPTGTQFKVIVSNSIDCSITSTVATLLVNEIKGISPSITNVTQCYGTNYSYTVSTSYPANVVSYQWKSSVSSGVWNNIVNGTHFSGANTATLNIINGTPAESAEYRVYVSFHSSGADCNINSATRTRQITFLPLLSPPLFTITQPDCITPTGGVFLNGLPSLGTWTLTRSPGAATTSGTGTSTLISGLAPETYTYTVTSGSCISAASSNVVIQAATTAIWNGTTWTNGPPTINQALEFTGDYTSPTDLSACSCTITNGAVVFNPTHSLTIANWVRVNGGSLTFENMSSLVQVKNVSNTNTGNITYKRKTTKITKMDYTYWSIPVLPFTLGGVSPNTLGDKFYSYNSSVQDWKQESATTSMVPGLGYIIRGPQNYTINNPALYEASFVGVPNNGHYEITGITADRSYLLGNPYPSSLDADAFLDANQNVLDGTLYFWTHNTPITIGTKDATTGSYAYSGNDYATYNRTGGVSTIAPAPSSFFPLTSLNGNIPNGKITSGQGFFGASKTVVDGFVSGTPLIFDNTMRIGVSDISKEDNTQFFKTKNPKAIVTKILEKHRIWLDLTNSQGAFKQTLVGYITDASNEYEGRFDGVSFEGNDFLDFYSILQDKNLTIQGRALPFDKNDEIPLGYRVALDGTFSIALNQTDGILSNQQVYLEDKLTNVVFNLKDGKYTFSTEEGTFDDRFVLRYTYKTLRTEKNEVNDGMIVLYSNNYKTLIIRHNIKDTPVNSVILYNMVGQKIANWEVKELDQSNIQIPIKNLPSEMYIVKVKTTKGECDTKIIVN